MQMVLVPVGLPEETLLSLGLVGSIEFFWAPRGLAYGIGGLCCSYLLPPPFALTSNLNRLDFPLLPSTDSVRTYLFRGLPGANISGYDC